MNWLTSLLKEYQNYKLFFSEAHEPARKLVFFSEKDIYFQTFQPFIEEILSQSSVEFSYITSDSKDPILLQKNPRLHAFYFKSFLKAVFDKIDARAFVLTMPDLQTYHLKRSEKTKEYIYCFHSFSSTHLQYNERAFDAFDTIFCVGAHHLKEIKKREEKFGLKTKKLLPVGYPRIDKISETYENNYSNVKTTPQKILIAPTWSMASLLENGIDELIRQLSKTPFEKVLRPHPEFLKRRPKLAKKIKARLALLPNFIFEDTLLNEQNLYEADILITDRSGIAFEYAFGLKKPVIFIETPMKIHNPNYKALRLDAIEIVLREQVGISLKLEELPKINEHIATLLKNQALWKEKLTHLDEKYLFNPMQSAKCGSSYLLDKLL